MRKANFLIVAIVMFAAIVTGCKKEEDKKTGQINLEITDAPSDDENIQATFITISMIKIDGEAVEGFEKQTVNISNYQNGETKQLFTGELDAKSYSNISVELDFETDVAGTAPGCYILGTNNKKHDLAASDAMQMEVVFDHDFTIEKGQSTTLVVDFDLRKAVMRNNSSQETNYSFVADADLKSSLRLVETGKAGSIAGQATINSGTSLEFIAYVYKKGEYSFIAETQGQGSGNVLFSNAITSSKIKEDGSYVLAFLEEGDYEIHVASYSRTIIGGRLNFTGMANTVSLTPSHAIDNIHVSANAEVELDISIAVTGL